MDVFSIFTLLGGLAFFLYGMNIMSNGLEKMTGGKLEKILKKMTSNPIKSLMLGAGITIAIQSSSAMTVMLVGFVNSGIMELGQTVGVIMGSNIGTTLTTWIFALVGVRSDNMFIRFFNPESFSPIIALIGILMIMVSSDKKKRDIGNIMLGFSILMFGMTLMSDAVSPLADMPEFGKLMVAFKNPLLGVALGTIVTGIIQSSAASVAILQALAITTGSITYGIAIPIIMGQNIGTCVTALLSSIGVNKNAKRVAVVHISFNMIGTCIWLTVYVVLNAIFHFSITNQSISSFGIAACHSIFNLLTTFMLIPFAKQLEKLANIVIKSKDEEEKISFLDDRLIATPSVAIAACKERTVKMSNLVSDNLDAAIDLIKEYRPKTMELIDENEKFVDTYEDNLGTYLVKLGGRELSEADSKEISKMLHVIGDFERIGDHAQHIAHVARDAHDKQIDFSASAIKELEVITSAINEIMKITLEAYAKNDITMAQKVEPLEQVIDYLKGQLKQRHIKRLRKGECTIEHGFIFTELLTDYERISDHCSNIAVCVIQVSSLSFDTHEYLQEVKQAAKGNFKEDFDKYLGKYDISL